MRSGIHSKLVVAAPGHYRPLSDARGKAASEPICPACGSEAIRTGPYLICIFDDCTAQFAAKPSVVQSVSSLPSMAQQTMTETARVSTIEGQGGHD
jgi:hypothetical protein